MSQDAGNTLLLPRFCPKCGYSLEGLAEPLRCPECGQRVAALDVVLTGYQGRSLGRVQTALRGAWLLLRVGCAIFLVTVTFADGIPGLRFNFRGALLLAVDMLPALLVIGILAMMGKGLWSSAGRTPSLLLRLCAEGYSRRNGPGNYAIIPWPKRMYVQCKVIGRDGNGQPEVRFAAWRMWGRLRVEELWKMYIALTPENVDEIRSRMDKWSVAHNGRIDYAPNR